MRTVIFHEHRLCFPTVWEVRLTEQQKVHTAPHNVKENTHKWCTGQRHFPSVFHRPLEIHHPRQRLQNELRLAEDFSHEFAFPCANPSILMPDDRQFEPGHNPPTPSCKAAKTCSPASHEESASHIELQLQTKIEYPAHTSSLIVSSPFPHSIIITVPPPSQKRRMDVRDIWCAACRVLTGIMDVCCTLPGTTGKLSTNRSMLAWSTASSIARAVHGCTSTKTHPGWQEQRSFRSGEV